MTRPAKIPVVAVSGAGGQLGLELKRLAPDYPGYRFVFLTRAEFPLDQPDRLREWLATHHVDFFINAAAYTAVDKAESEKETAFAVNGEAPGIIAAGIAGSGGRLLQVSTDYVFDGLSSAPLNEAAATAPINVYGESKLAGEKNALRENPQTMVVRTSWLYSTFGNNFVKTMLRLMATRESLQVVSDQRGSPTNARDLARALLDIISRPVFIPGVYHYSNEGEASWFEFAREIKKLSGSSCQVNPVGSDGYPTAAKRPAWSLLDKTKIRDNYGLVIPDWKPSLAGCVNEILAESKKGE